MIYSIYVFHYILMSLGLSAVLILITLFLQTYSDASLSEIGALLMALPFLSIIAKPLFCALADRQQAHKAYLMGSLFFMALGYGSITIAPFFPEFVAQHGRLVWYLDVVGVTVGFTGFGVAFSIGDALSVFAANKKGIPWGSYRVWATVAWGVGGCIIGQINETPLLPKYTPAFFVLVGSLVFEIFLLAVWPNHVFDMSFTETDLAIADANNSTEGKQHPDDLELNELNWPSNRSMAGTLSGSSRLKPRLMGAMAGVFMEDLGSSLRGSLSGKQPKRSTLAEVLEQHKLTSGGVPTFDANQVPLTPVLGRGSIAPASPQVTPLKPHPSSPSIPLAVLSNSSPRPSEAAGMSMGKAALRRTQLALSRMNSLSSASGHVMAADLVHTNSGIGAEQFGSPQVPRRLMSNANINASLSRTAAARALELGRLSSMKDSPGGESQASNVASADSALEKKGEQYVEDLQLVLFKLIVRRNPSIVKYLIVFTFIGILFTTHLAYFFIHVQHLCEDKGFDFSSVMGAFTVAHAISEVLGFLIVVPYVMPFFGRFGSMMTPILIFFSRYLFYGTYYEEVSPWWALASEFGHGFAYSVTYSLITEIATECVDDVDQYLPELIQRGIVPASINPEQLKVPLRATMYGVFSGAFDGLGNGIGSLLGGIYLDSHPFTGLWLCCTYLAGSVAVAYPISEWRLICGSNGASKKQTSVAAKM